MSYSDRPRSEDDAAAGEAVQPGAGAQKEPNDSSQCTKTVIGACRSRRGAAIVTHPTND